MPFNDAERVLRDAVEVAETFQQAVDAAAAIYEYEKKKQRARKNRVTIRRWISQRHKSRPEIR